MNQILIPSFDVTDARATIEACGAQMHDDPHGPQARFGQAPADADASAGGSAAKADALRRGSLSLLADWGIVSVSGDEAVKFLQGQTTNDIEQQAADELRLNGYCTPKGRLLAGGPLWRDGAALRFAVSRPLAEPLRKRLSMFVLRAKARVEDASGAFAILGLTGEVAPDALRELGIEAPAPLRCARATVAADGPLAIGFAPVDGIGARYWLVVPQDSLGPIWRSLAQHLSTVSSDWWRTTEILAGEPRIVPATSETFVPQTLNWELIGGVSFRKGCYPGQEIVARMHYRGKPKRRTFVGQLADGSAPAPGDDVLAGGVNEPAGVVVSSAPSPEGGYVLLYEAAIDSALQGGLRLADGRPLESRVLPYLVPGEALAQ
jgi:folate-binding protein YgfZ